MNAQVSVRTADRVPIVGASVSVDGGSKSTTDTSGVVAVAPAGNTFTVTASAANYSDQTTIIDVANDGSFTWDDPGTIVTGSGGQFNIEIRLGRMQPAPTVAFDDDLMKIPDAVFKTFKNPVNPSYIVPLQHTFVVDDGEYAFLFAGKKRFWAATGATMIGNQNAKGWDALVAKASPIEPRMRGHFIWVEWAPPGGSPAALNRYLVGLWRPQSSSISGSTPRDAIIFFTPNTSASRGYLSDSPPYRKTYPYALNQADGNPRALAQRYVGLGLRYLFNEKCLTYQMLAAARDAIVVVPIQPAEQWGILQTPAGIQRLLDEAVLFEHRQRIFPDDVADRLDTAPQRNSRGGLTVRTRAARFLPPPSLGLVVTAGFSAGMSAVKSLVQLAGGRSPTGVRSWQSESQDSYSANPAEFIASWREIWDLDGSVNAIGNVGSWVTTLANWQRVSGHYSAGQSDRIGRCYHTDYTGWSSQSLTLTNSFVGDPVPGNQPSSSANPRAAERYGKNGSAVWFSHNYLTGNGPAAGWNPQADPPDTPAFWLGTDPPNDVGANGHQAVPVICFAHAAGLSRLRKL